MTNIFDEEFEESGEFTDRMIQFGLENVKWLFEREILKPKSAFIWGVNALWYLPKVSEEFWYIILKIYNMNRDRIACDKELLPYALRFMRDLVERRSLLWGKRYHKLAKVVETFLDIEGDEVVLCWKAWAYSSLAYGLIKNGYWDYGLEYLKKAEKIVNKLEKLRGLAEVKFLLSKAQIKTWKNLNLNDTIKILKNCLGISEKLEFEDYTAKFFKPFGGKTKEMFEDQLKEWKKDINYELGRAYLRSNLEKARRYFEESLKFAKRFDSYLSILGRIGRIRVLKISGSILKLEVRNTTSKSCGKCAKGVFTKLAMKKLHFGVQNI